MQAIFSEEELANLESKVWWVACNETPFLIRSAIFDTTILINITDLRTMWAVRVDQETLLKQKQIFAKTLQTASFKQFLALFSPILSNPDKNALYQFIKKKDYSLTFKVEKQIEVYPFSWKFELIEVEADIVKMLCRDILNPLARTLNAQQKRYQIARKKMEIMERDLLKKMSETQKKYYKSPLIEDEQDYKLLISIPKQQQFIADLRLQGTSRIIFENSMLSSKKAKTNVEKKGHKEKQGKVEIRVPIFKQMNAEQLMIELEMKKQEEEQRKKKKTPDFI